MQSLRDYEGPRGVAYLLGIVACLAPTTIAMFLIEPDKFTTLEWPQVLLLCACIGGTSIALNVVGAAFAFTPSPTDTDEEKIDAMRGALVAGATFSLMAQLIALVIATRYENAFSGFVRVMLWISLGTAILPSLFEAMGRADKKKRGK